MTNLGVHLIVDAWDAPAELLDDLTLVERALREAVEAGSATLIDLCSHRFSPHGVTATATLAESHIAIHTWPEHGYFACDLFFCGEGDPYAAFEPIRELLQAGETRTTEIKRGMEPVALSR